jgi:hypothetical protein
LPFAIRKSEGFENVTVESVASWVTVSPSHGTLVSEFVVRWESVRGLGAHNSQRQIWGKEPQEIYKHHITFENIFLVYISCTKGFHCDVSIHIDNEL